MRNRGDYDDGTRRRASRRRIWNMIKMKEKTLKDVIEQTKHNAYLGKFWNRYIKDFQTWEENQKWEERFESFCSRMWLDNEDENLTLPASGNRLSKQAYINKWENWLVKKFLERNGNV